MGLFQRVKDRDSRVPNSMKNTDQLHGTVPFVNVLIKTLRNRLCGEILRYDDVGANRYELSPHESARLLRFINIIEAAENDEELERLLHQIETYWELVRDREAV